MKYKCYTMNIVKFRILVFFLALWLSEISFSQETIDHGEGTVSYICIESGDTAIDTIMYYFGGYLIKHEKVVRYDKLNPRDDIGYKGTFKLKATTSQAAGIASTNMQVRGTAVQKHTKYILNFKEKSKQLFFKRNDSIFVFKSFDTLHDKVVPDTYYIPGPNNLNRNNYAINFIADTSAVETIAGIRCYQALAFYNQDTLLIKYSKGKVLVRSPLNMFLPDSFSYNVMQIIKTVSVNSSTRKRRYEITKITEDAISEKEFEIPKDATLVFSPPADILGLMQNL